MMTSVSINSDVISRTLLLKSYAQAMTQQRRIWATTDMLISQLMGLSKTEPLNAALVPSAADLRQQLNTYWRSTQKLSDLIIAMREE